MSEAPDRIWACVSKNTKSGVVALLGDATFAVDGWQEYIRADRIEAQAAEIEWYRDRVVWGFYEDETPKFYQGKEGEHEICEPVSAKEVTCYVNEIEMLEAKLEKLIGGAETVLEAWDHHMRDVVVPAALNDAIEEMRADVEEAKKQ